MRNIFDVLQKIKEIINENDGYEEIKVEIEDIEYSLKYKAPELQWNFVYVNLITKFIPPKTEMDYKILSIWTTKSVEELKKSEDMQ